MRIFKLSILLGLTLLMAVSCSLLQKQKYISDGDYSFEAFRPLYDSLEVEADLVKLYTEFIENSSDMEVIRRVQGYWMRMDEEGCAVYAKAQSDKDPESARNLYLYGRTVDSPVEKIELGRKIINTETDWPYGYRLALVSYDQNLFDGDSEDEYYEQLKTMVTEDAALFEKYVTVDTADTYPLQLLADYQVYQGDFESALATMDKAKEMGQRWPSAVDYAGVFVRNGEFDKAYSLFEEQFKAMEANDERVSYINRYYTSVLLDAKAYDEVININNKNKNLDNDADALYNLACVYSLKGNYPEALNTLSKSADAGWESTDHTAKDTDLTPLHELEGWDGVLAKVQKNWDDGAEKRKEEALAGKISEVAPLWTLADKDGKMVSLADLKGNVIILDFWATWCGPCRMAMPDIDKFVKEKMPENVKVFSVNVWEKGQTKPINFMKENDYAMTLLFGNNAIAEEYGCEGIPYLVVIDKEGNIAFKHTGYAPGLDENLVIWSEALL